MNKLETWTTTQYRVEVSTWEPRTLSYGKYTAVEGDDNWPTFYKASAQKTKLVTAFSYIVENPPRFRVLRVETTCIVMPG